MSTPNLQLGGLSLWVHGWQFETASDLDDANWLQITAEQRSAESRVITRGPIIQATDIVAFLSELKVLDATLSGEATLSGHEPNLKVILRCSAERKIAMRVDISPAYPLEKHQFLSEIEQSDLGNAIRSLESILAEFSPRAAG